MTNVFYTIIIASAVLMLLCTNPINSVLFLILIFLSASVILFLIGCDFIGLVFIIIYLGAIAVLFLFIVMMVNVKRIEGDTTTYLLIGFLFLFIFCAQLFYYVVNFLDFNIFANMYVVPNTMSFDQSIKVDYFNKKEYFVVLGRVLYLDYFLFMVCVSMLLLLGMIGSIFLTNYKNNFSSKKQLNQLSRNNKLVNIHLF